MNANQILALGFEGYGFVSQCGTCESLHGLYSNNKNAHFKSTRLNLYCLPANAILCAKLIKVFEEAKFRCVKVQFFSGSVV